MKNVRAVFKDDQVRLLASAGVELSNEHDYTEDELLDIYDLIGDKITEGFTRDGEPKPSTLLWESVMDRFLDRIDGNQGS